MEIKISDNVLLKINIQKIICMQKILLIFSVLVISRLSFGFAQTPQEETIEFNKKMVPAVCVVVPNMEVSSIQKSFQLFMEKQGLKATINNKFQTYLNQPLAEISPDNLDIYYCC